MFFRTFVYFFDVAIVLFVLLNLLTAVRLYLQSRSRRGHRDNH